MKQVTVGLAGHIDHGKTSIVQMLTGKNTDSLKEEIKRGMTIDIGFAHFNENISLIDVPGHEKFIKNMVSGVNSIDFAILIVAADDGIMPQTYEHLEILQLLNVKSGMIVINKVDLIEDSEMLDLVEIEINEFVKNTFLENSKVLKTSVKTGLGIDLLKEEIKMIPNTKSIKFNRNIFRMFIDRVFIKKGFGTVVTGTVSSGQASIGDIVEILPQNISVKIRGLHSHDKQVEKIEIGDRAAINLQCKEKVSFKRGNQLSSKNFFSRTKLIGVRINTLLKTKTKIKHNQRVRFHLGTQEVMARILLSGEKNNLSFSAIIKLEKYIIASFKDRFIIRSYSPVSTIGGGEILDSNLEGRWSFISKYVNELFKSENIGSRIKTIIECNNNIYNLDSLSKKMGIANNLLDKYLKDMEDIIYFKINNIIWLFTEKKYEILEKDIIQFLEYNHKKNPDRAGYLKEELNKKFKFSLNLLEEILLNLSKKKLIKIENEFYSKIDFSIQFSDKDKLLKNKIISLLNEERFATSNLENLSKIINESKNDILRILKIESAKNTLIIIKNSIYLTEKNYKMLLKIVNDFYKVNETMNIKQFKDLTNTTRKYAVPLLEYLDKQKVTYRFGDERKINR
tara:strand:+ start:535 stop:2403 length:1869 start_codon:yes stop_codon:yes gene_type:complete